MTGVQTCALSDLVAQSAKIAQSGHADGECVSEIKVREMQTCIVYQPTLSLPMKLNFLSGTKKTELF